MRWLRALSGAGITAAAAYAPAQNCAFMSPSLLRTPVAGALSGSANRLFHAHNSRQQPRFSAPGNGGLRGVGRALSTAAGGGGASDESLKVLYDGKCPICVFEIKWLEKKSKKMEGGGEGIRFVDVAAEEGYTPEANGGVSYEDAMRVMTVVRPDGTVSKGMGAFEDMYAAVGMGWVFAFLKYKSLRRLFDNAYDFWAAYRLPVTGRGSLDVHLAEREQCQRDACKARRDM